MNENMKIKIFWQPEGTDSFVEVETTLATATKWHATWVEDVKNGSTYIVKDYPKGPNKGVMIIIVNPR